MNEILGNYLHEHRTALFALLRHYVGLDRPFLLRSDLWDEFEAFCDREEYAGLCDSSLARLISFAQEAVCDPPWVCVAIRPRIASWSYLRYHLDEEAFEEIGVSEFLAFKERLKRGGASQEWILELDLGPFNRDFPKLTETRSIGRGVDFLNRRLSSQLFRDLGRGDRKLLEFLRVHHWQNRPLMLNGRIREVPQLRTALRQADDYLAEQSPEATWSEVGPRLEELGFEPGWGRTTSTIRDSLSLLTDILEAPAPGTLEEFLARIPMIFNIVILSPHGYFGQSDVLGRPDTGGQVVYILDQVRALEKEMRRRVHEQGLDIEPQILVITRLIPESEGTTCDQRTEAIIGTRNARILRVPFRDESGRVVPQWVSRFALWPYLERFAAEAKSELLAELGTRPDLVIGNYSDGNLVATLLSQSLQVTQCNIAHALEKTKYLYSDLYWEENDAEYHFGAQFTADLIGINAADFVITSTYQEIAGTENSVGQYESYGAFTMPGLYRVVNGVDVFDPKFNIVSPGADADVYFPYYESERRRADLTEEVRALLNGPPDEKSRGRFVEQDKPIVFSMARLDRVKNLTGLVEWFGRSDLLRREANLLVIGGHVDPDASGDAEERAQIIRMHELFDELELDGEVRWLGSHLSKPLAGELYRVVADSRGIFAQPALFEAFGLTVIEAMTSGLPTFATRYGGPHEIIEHARSGFHIDPNHGEKAAEAMGEFLTECRGDPNRWGELSEAAIARVRSRYTWELYAQRLTRLACIYGFWKYVTNLERDETRRYLEMFYGLQYRPLAKSVDVGTDS
jgi:sucrose synthase